MTGPSVVAVGGGHGLAATLRAVRLYASSVVGVVSVADDGGSSGRLRQSMPDLPAPGDVRRCLGALADDTSVMGRALEHRFHGGELDGHAFGNILLAVLTEQLGSFTAAVDEVARQIGAVGRVLPATQGPVSLEGRRTEAEPGLAPGGQRVVGQVAVQNTAGLAQVRLRPTFPDSPPAVAAAILAADQVVIGPGSLFTSVLAAAVVPAVRTALALTDAPLIYVANLSPQLPETEGYSVVDEVAALFAHGIDVDVVLCDPSRSGGQQPSPKPFVEMTVAHRGGLVHDPFRLAEALEALSLRY